MCNRTEDTLPARNTGRRKVCFNQRTLIYQHIAFVPLILLLLQEKQSKISEKPMCFRELMMMMMIIIIIKIKHNINSVHVECESERDISNNRGN
jgi:hypothetical protein